MKKLLAILLALSMVLTLAACGKGDSTDDSSSDTTSDNKKEVSVMGSLSNGEINDLIADCESVMLENEDASMQFGEEMSGLLKKSEYSDDYGLNDDGIEEAKSIFINIFIDCCSDEEIDMYAEFIYANLKYSRAMSVYEAEISEYINKYGTIDDDDFKQGYIDMMCSYGVPEWYVKWNYTELFGDSGVVAENDNKNKCVINQRVLVSNLTSHLQGVAIMGYTEITIVYDGYNVDVTIEGDAISYDQFMSLYDELPYCPAKGTIVLGISMNNSGNVVVNCVCRDNQDGADHSL